MTTTPPTTRARPAVRAGPADDIVVLDDDGRTDPSDPEDQASVLQRRSRVATAVAAVCVYEAAAEIANAALDVDLFPSISAAVRRIGGGRSAMRGPKSSPPP